MTLKEIYEKVLEDKRVEYMEQNECIAKWDTLGYFYSEHDEDKALEEGLDYIENCFNEVVSEYILQDRPATEELKNLVLKHIKGE